MPRGSGGRGGVGRGLVSACRVSTTPESVPSSRTPHAMVCHRTMAQARSAPCAVVRKQQRALDGGGRTRGVVRVYERTRGSLGEHGIRWVVLPMRRVRGDGGAPGHRAGRRQLREARAQRRPDGPRRAVLEPRRYDGPLVEERLAMVSRSLGPWARPPASFLGSPGPGAV